MRLCDYGCGREATHQFKNGKWCCENHVNKCPSRKIGLKKIFLNKKHTPESKKLMSISRSFSSVKLYNNQKILCEYGCGRLAKYQVNKIKHKFCCSKFYNQCPAMIKINKDRSGKANRDPLKRKTHSKLMKKENPMDTLEYRLKVIKKTQDPKYKEKMSKKISKLWESEEFRDRFIKIQIEKGNYIAHDQLTKFQLYHREVYKYTQRTLKYFNYIVNPENKPIGRYLNNVDHIYSIFNGFKNNVEPRIIGSFVNLQVMPWKDNYKKHTKCGIILDELIKRFEEECKYEKIYK